MPGSLQSHEEAGFSSHTGRLNWRAWRISRIARRACRLPMATESAAFSSISGSPHREWALRKAHQPDPGGPWRACDQL